MAWEIIGTKHLRHSDFRSVDALTGEIAASPITKILDTADEIHAELADVRELQTRLQELQAEDDAKAELIGELVAERDELAEKLRELDEAHSVTLSLLAKAKSTEPWHGRAATR